MHNDGNYVISLGNVVRWLGQKAEELEVSIFPGFAASEILYHEDGTVKGIQTGDMGIGKMANRRITLRRVMSCMPNTPSLLKAAAVI